MTIENSKLNSPQPSLKSREGESHLIELIESEDSSESERPEDIRAEWPAPSSASWRIKRGPGGVKFRKRLRIFLAALAGLVILAGLAALDVYWKIYRPVNKKNTAQIEFVIERGKGVEEIGAQLAEADLIRSQFWFETYVWYKKQGSALQAGKYALSQSFNVPDIVAVLSGGKVVDDSLLITFPEGFTLSQISQRMAADSRVPAAAALGDAKITDYEMQYKFLKDAPADHNLEGFLFPDSYRFLSDDSKEKIVKKFLDNFDKKLTPDLREELNKQGRRIYDILILASIVQQEAQTENEMPRLAGIFMNRLRAGMLLQSDATVNYVTGKKLRQVTLEDTKIKSSYNTYLNVGLPPGPIANPGLSAIRAAIYPEATNFFYFFHPLNGPTIFSTTMDEHNRNRQKYLK